MRTSPSEVWLTLTRPRQLLALMNITPGPCWWVLLTVYPVLDHDYKSVLLLISQGIWWRQWAPYLQLAGRGLRVVDTLWWEVGMSGWAWSLHGEQTWVVGWVQWVGAPRFGHSVQMVEWIVCFRPRGYPRLIVHFVIMEFAYRQN